jgi:hypothetical protein
MKTYEERRREEREYQADVEYEAWRRGINPDRASECASDCYYDGKTASECVDGTQRELRRQREARELRMFEEEQMRQYEEEYYRNMNEANQ